MTDIAVMTDVSRLSPAKRVGLDVVRALVLNGLDSDHSKRSYGRSIDRFLEWWLARPEPRAPLSRALVLEYRDNRRRRVAPASVNVELSAVRRLATEAADAGLLSHEFAHQVNSVRGIKARGTRLGNWMNLDELRDYVPPAAASLIEKRDRAVLATLSGCALRRTELASLKCSHIQLRDERWVFLDIRGKGGRVRTVPIPEWVYGTISDWRQAARIDQPNEGPLFRRMTPMGDLTVKGISDKTVWLITHRRSVLMDSKIAPHDLRRTCAKLCRENGGRLEDISSLLGHAQIATTQRYLGSENAIRHAANDLFAV